MKRGTKQIPNRKFFLQVNDIVRHDGIVYRVDYVQPATNNYILHQMETGCKIPFNLMGERPIILLSKRTKMDLKRNIRIMRRVRNLKRSINSAVLEKSIISPSLSNETIEQSVKQVEVSKEPMLDIVESYIEKKEQEELVEKKVASSSYIPSSITTYCSIM
jgi:hypothetical protein